MSEIDAEKFGRLVGAVEGLDRRQDDFQKHVCKHLDQLRSDTMKNRVILVGFGASGIGGLGAVARMAGLF